MSEGRIAAVGRDAEIAIFRTAGIKTCAVNSPDDAKKAVNSLSEQGMSVILITEMYAELLEEELKRYRAKAYPIILTIPNGGGNDGYAMKKLIANMEKAIGTNIFKD